MDSQSKLSKNEWTSIEKSVDNKEKQILELIVRGYSDPNYSIDLYFTIAKCSVIIVGVYLLTQTNKYSNVCS